MENNINSKEKLIAYLSLIRDQETEKPLDEADNDLIKACVELLLELQGKEVTLSTEDIEELVRKIPFADTEMIKTVNTKGKVRKFKKKKILLIAAVIAILVAILSIVSIAFEWNIFDSIKDKFGSLLNSPIGVEQTENGITFENLGEIKEYKNIQEVIENEDLGILLPTNLTNNLAIEMIKVYEVDGNQEIFVSLNNGLSYIVTSGKNIPKNVVDKLEIMVINEFELYIEYLEDVNLYQVYFTYNNDFYNIMYNDKQVLLEIIENLEEQ